MAKLTVKRSDVRVEIKTFSGKKCNYLVITAGDGKFHVFAEVQAKEAAIDCGCKLNPRSNNPTTMWREMESNPIEISTSV
jgi:hypothetical protein